MEEITRGLFAQWCLLNDIKLRFMSADVTDMLITGGPKESLKDLYKQKGPLAPYCPCFSNVKSWTGETSYVTTYSGFFICRVCESEFYLYHKGVEHVERCHSGNQQTFLYFKKTSNRELSNNRTQKKAKSAKRRNGTILYNDGMDKSITSNVSDEVNHDVRLLKRRKLETQSDTRSFQCGFCVKKFAFKTSLANHVANFHPNESNLANIYQDKVVDSASAKDIFIDRPTEVEIAQESMSSVNHPSMAHLPGQHLGNTNGKEMVSGRTKEHMINNSTLSSPNIANGINTLAQQNYNQHRFDFHRDRNTLNDFRSGYMDTGSNLNNPAVQEYPCNFCDKIFGYASTLRIHVRYGHKRYI